MAVFKCKMCGAALEVANGTSIIECEYCGTQQTLPKLEDEKRANLYDRANHFRRNNEFDKAIGIYEKILNEDPTDAEAYWSLVLCRYGIEYVEDPATHKRVPTVNRAQFTSVFDDEDYKSALQNADMYQRAIYEAEANAINEIQKGILAISQKEEPFDVFICYKESDNNGRRTPDSVLAQELYFQLKQEGFKVFFARITLEDKLGAAYEPYIFAALNSAKVMVVLGTKPEYFNAVWVKNEWSRYLALIKQGKQKTLIPAYKDMDPYDLPEEFSHLQAQDMSKLGFMQDLIRGIGKIAHTEEPKQTVIKETVVSATATNTAPLLRRAFMFLEDGDWNSANEYCEKVLDIDPECAEAYLGKLMAELKVKTQEDLKNCAKPFNDRNNYNKVLRFGDDNLRNALTGYIKFINDRNETARLDGIYHRAFDAMGKAQTEDAFKSAAELFASIKQYKNSAELAEKCYTLGKEVVYNDALKQMNSANSESEFVAAAKKFEKVPGFKDADERAQKCYENAEIASKDEILSLAIVFIKHFDYEAAAYKLETIKGFKNADSLLSECYKKIEKKKAEAEENRKYLAYNNAVHYMDRKSISGYREAITALESIHGYRDADELLITCRGKIEAIEIQAKAEQAEKERLAEVARIEKEKRRKRNKKIAAVVIPIILLIAVAVIVYFTVVVPSQKYNDAMAMYESGNYVGASVAFQNLEDYKDSATMVKECQYQNALNLVCEGRYNEALGIFGMLGSYSDSTNKMVLVQALKGLNGENFEWTIKTILEANERVNIRYNLSGGTSTLGDYITYLNAAEYSLLIPEKLGYKLAEWKFNSFSYNKETSLEVVLDAVWSDGYIIKYNLDGGTADNPVEYHKDRDAVVIADPVREGYTFLGWTGTDLNTPTKNLTIPAGSYGDKEYTANWKANEYTISFDANGGTVNSSSIVVRYDDQCILPIPTRDYYTFAGWYNKGIKYDDGVWNKTSSVKLAAEWTPVSYTVNYSLSGGTNNSSNVSSYNVETGIHLYDPSKYGYKFMGWYTDTSFKTKVTEIPVGSYGNITLYAKWEIATYTITYELNGGKISGTKKTTFTVNDLPLALPTASKTDCVFLGWGLTGYNATAVKTLNVCGDVTLCATYRDVYLQLTLFQPSSYQGTGAYYKVTKYSGSATTVDIPSYIDGYPVKEISSSAFANNTSVTTVNIPNTITTIGGSAFKGCTSLKNITIPDSVTSIASSTFQGCTALTSITIPNTVTSIGANAFENCTKLKNVQLPNKLTKMGYYAFKGCSSLTSIEIPGTLKEIEYCTFARCTNLSTVVLNEGLEEIGFGAFDSLKITKLIIPKSVTTIAADTFDYWVYGACSNINFYCRASFMPSGWSSGWNINRPVVWGYTGN